MAKRPTKESLNLSLSSLNSKQGETSSNINDIPKDYLISNLKPRFEIKNKDSVINRIFLQQKSNVIPDKTVKKRIPSTYDVVFKSNIKANKNSIIQKISKKNASPSKPSNNSIFSENNEEIPNRNYNKRKSIIDIFNNKKLTDGNRKEKLTKLINRSGLKDIISKSIDNVHIKQAKNSLAENVSQQIIQQLNIPPEHYTYISMEKYFKHNNSKKPSVVPYKERKKSIRINRKKMILPGSIFSLGLEQEKLDNKRNVYLLTYLFKYLSGFNKFIKFNNIEDKSIEKVVNWITIKHYEKQEFVYKSGEDADFMYAILDGHVSIRSAKNQKNKRNHNKYSNEVFLTQDMSNSIELNASSKSRSRLLSTSNIDKSKENYNYTNFARKNTIKNLSNKISKQSNNKVPEEEILAILGGGDIFGESDLISKIPRRKNAIAESKSIIFRLDKDCFNDCFGKSVAKAEYDRKASLFKIFPFLRKYNVNKVNGYYEKMKYVYYDKNKYVLEENTPAKKIYITLYGECVLFKSSFPEEISIIKPVIKEESKIKLFSFDKVNENTEKEETIQKLIFEGILKHDFLKIKDKELIKIIKEDILGLETVVNYLEVLDYTYKNKEKLNKEKDAHLKFNSISTLNNPNGNGSSLNDISSSLNIKFNSMISKKNLQNLLINKQTGNIGNRKSKKSNDNSYFKNYDFSVKVNSEFAVLLEIDLSIFYEDFDDVLPFLYNVYCNKYKVLKDRITKLINFKPFQTINYSSNYKNYLDTDNSKDKYIDTVKCFEVTSEMNLKKRDMLNLNKNRLKSIDMFSASQIKEEHVSSNKFKIFNQEITSFKPIDSFIDESDYIRSRKTNKHISIITNNYDNSLDLYSPLPRIKNVSYFKDKALNSNSIKIKKHSIYNSSYGRNSIDDFSNDHNKIDNENETILNSKSNFSYKIKKKINPPLEFNCMSNNNLNIINTNTSNNTNIPYLNTDISYNKNENYHNSKNIQNSIYKDFKNIFNKALQGKINVDIISQDKDILTTTSCFKNSINSESSNYKALKETNHIMATDFNNESTTKETISKAPLIDLTGINTKFQKYEEYIKKINKKINHQREKQRQKKERILLRRKSTTNNLNAQKFFINTLHTSDIFTNDNDNGASKNISIKDIYKLENKDKDHNNNFKKYDSSNKIKSVDLFKSNFLKNIKNRVRDVKMKDSLSKVTAHTEDNTIKSIINDDNNNAYNRKEFSFKNVNFKNSQATIISGMIKENNDEDVDYEKNNLHDKKRIDDNLETIKTVMSDEDFDVIKSKKSSFGLITKSNDKFFKENDFNIKEESKVLDTLITYDEDIDDNTNTIKTNANENIKKNGDEISQYKKEADNIEANKQAQSIKDKKLNKENSILNNSIKLIEEPEIAQEEQIVQNTLLKSFNINLNKIMFSPSKKDQINRKFVKRNTLSQAGLSNINNINLFKLKKPSLNYDEPNKIEESDDSTYSSKDDNMIKDTNFFSKQRKNKPKNTVHKNTKLLINNKIANKKDILSIFKNLNINLSKTNNGIQDEMIRNFNHKSTVSNSLIFNKINEVFKSTSTDFSNSKSINLKKSLQSLKTSINSNNHFKKSSFISPITNKELNNNESLENILVNNNKKENDILINNVKLDKYSYKAFNEDNRKKESSKNNLLDFNENDLSPFNYNNFSNYQQPSKFSKKTTSNLEAKEREFQDNKSLSNTANDINFILNNEKMLKEIDKKMKDYVNNTRKMRILNILSTDESTNPSNLKSIESIAPNTTKLKSILFKTTRKQSQTRKKALFSPSKVIKDSSNMKSLGNNNLQEINNFICGSKYDSGDFNIPLLAKYKLKDSYK